MTTSHPADQGLVPLADRFRYLQFLRLAMVLPILLTTAIDPGQSTLSLKNVWLLCATYLLLTLPTVRAWRLARTSAISIFGGSLLLDGVFLGITTYGTGGLTSPVRYLVLLHVVSVTLCASFRTGLKIAVWHSLLLGSAYQLQSAHIVHAATAPRAVDLIANVVAILLVTAATASFGAVNERELRRRNYDLHALSGFAFALETVSSPEEVADALVEAVVDSAGCARIVMAAAATGELTALAGRDVSPVRSDLRPDADALVVEAMRSRSTLRVRTVDPDLDPWLAAAMPDAHNVVVVPLYSEAGPLGVLVFEHGDRGTARIERRVVEVVEQFVSQTALALQNAWLLAQVRGLAATDSLTGIANRRTFDSELVRELSRADRSGAALALIIVDIDHFKAHNDAHGHQVGDRTLQRVAAILRDGGRATDTVARYGGEEFVILLPGSDAAAAHLKAERYRQLIEEMAEKPGVTASFGVAVYPQHAESGSALIQAADGALYESKGAGRNRVSLAWRAVVAGATDAG
jgi:two-component system, cell cycle response regulator